MKQKFKNDFDFYFYKGIMLGIAYENEKNESLETVQEKLYICIPFFTLTITTKILYYD